MLKSVRYRSDAKQILGIGLVLCAIACAVYGLLLIPEIGGLEFEWEYLAIIGGMALLFILISVYFFCLAASCARRESKNQTMRNNLDCAVEPDATSPMMEGAVMIRVPESVDCKANGGSKLKLPEKIDLEKVKKVGKIVVPVAAACVVVAAISSNAKYKKQAKRRRQLYRWMG